MQLQPPPGANADEVNAWWNSLTEDERDQLIAEHPPELGNLNGIPAQVRDQVNTAVMNDDLNRPEDDVRHRNAAQVKQGLDHDRGSDPGNQRPVLLWAYDPLAFDGQGRAAIAIGDPDHAEDIAVIVPGAGNHVASGWLHGGHNDAINVYDQSKVAYPDGSWTWDKYVSVSEQLTTALKGKGAKAVGDYQHLWQSTVQGFALAQTPGAKLTSGDFGYLKPYYDRALALQSAGAQPSFGTVSTNKLTYQAQFGWLTISSMAYVPCSTSDRTIHQRLRSLPLRKGRCFCQSLRPWSLRNFSSRILSTALTASTRPVMPPMLIAISSR